MLPAIMLNRVHCIEKTLISRGYVDEVSLLCALYKLVHVNNYFCSRNLVAVFLAVMGIWYVCEIFAEY